MIDDFGSCLFDGAFNAFVGKECGEGGWRLPAAPFQSPLSRRSGRSPALPHPSLRSRLLAPTAWRLATAFEGPPASDSPAPSGCVRPLLGMCLKNRKKDLQKAVPPVGM